MRSRASRATLAILALLLTVPVPSLAVWFGLIVAPGTLAGQSAFVLAKCWLLILPPLWVWRVEHRWPRWSRPTGVEIGVGLSFGIICAGAIAGAYWWFGRESIDPKLLRDVAVNAGMFDRTAFLAMAAYWIFCNSLIEEIVWRWFVLTRLSVLIGTPLAILGSAACFTLHHVIATSLYFTLPMVALAALGVFFGGAVWGWLMARFGTLWASYVSHIIVDFVIFALGYRLLFG